MQGREIRKKRGTDKYQEINKEVRKSISKINANMCRTWQLKEWMLSPKEI